MVNILNLSELEASARKAIQTIQVDPEEPKREDLQICECCSGNGKLPHHFSKGALVHPCLWCNLTGKVPVEVNQAFNRVRKIGPVRYCEVFGV